MSWEWMGDPYAPQLRAAKAEGELARIKDELREFAEDNGFNPEMEPRDLLAKAAGAFRSCAAMSDARYDEVQRLKAEMEAMRLRLMPEGMEWPRFEDGEPVGFGCEFEFEGAVDVIESITFHCAGSPRFNYGLQDSGERVHGLYVRGERVKRPVLAADGEPLEVGQTVWTLDNPIFECGVIGFGNGVVHLKSGADHLLQREPSDLTHQRPVLDADGVLEPPDSIERIADEIDRLREEVALHLGDYLYDEDGNDSIQFSMELVAKRCRALAERERGE